MSIFLKQTDPNAPLRVDSPEALIAAIRRCGIIPFFENALPGYSIEEMTPREYWFDGEEGTLGPWDWKIDAVQTGEIAYGKFLCGGKAAFATQECYRDLLNWRRTQPKYALKEGDRQAYEAICNAGSLTTRELRRICGLKKGAMDAIVTRLEPHGAGRHGSAAEEITWIRDSPVFSRGRTKIIFRAVARKTNFRSALHNANARPAKRYIVRAGDLYDSPLLNII